MPGTIPARTDSSEALMEISVGPHHPATHGVLRLRLMLDGETIRRAEVEHGFLHTGIEKTAESLTWTQATTVLERMDYLNTLSSNLCYTLALEKLLGVVPAERAVFLRVMMTELHRIASHLFYLSLGSLDLGSTTPYFWGLDLRERITEILEEITGQRMHHNYFRVGGVAQDMPADAGRLILQWLAEFPSRLREVLDLLETNPIFLDRTRGIGKISAEQALGFGLTGPNLRACGVDYDVRKAYPYSGYERFQFQTVLGQNGDVLDRFRLRLREMEQSFQIVRQAFEGLPEGPHRISDPKRVPQPKAEVRRSMEALIHHFKLAEQGFAVPAGEVYQSVESARGELGMYVVSDGANRPLRVRVRPPSLYAVHALPAMLEGAQIADMVAIVASADPVFGEVDR